MFCRRNAVLSAEARDDLIKNRNVMGHLKYDLYSRQLTPLSSSTDENNHKSKTGSNCYVQAPEWPQNMNTFTILFPAVIGGKVNNGISKDIFS